MVAGQAGLTFEGAPQQAVLEPIELGQYTKAHTAYGVAQEFLLHQVTDHLGCIQGPIPHRKEWQPYLHGVVPERDTGDGSPSKSRLLTEPHFLSLKGSDIIVWKGTTEAVPSERACSVCRSILIRWTKVLQSEHGCLIVHPAPGGGGVMGMGIYTEGGKPGCLS